MFSEPVAIILGFLGIVVYGIGLLFCTLLMLFGFAFAKTLIDEQINYDRELAEEDTNFDNETDAEENGVLGFKVLLALLVIIFAYLILRLVASAFLLIGTKKVSSFVIKSMSVFY